MKLFFKKIWTGYKKVAGIIGKFNTMVILSLLYFTVVPVFALISSFKRGGDGKQKNSTWQAKESGLLNSHEHQF